MLVTSRKSAFVPPSCVLAKKKTDFDEGKERGLNRQAIPLPATILNASGPDLLRFTGGGSRYI